MSEVTAESALAEWERHRPLQIAMIRLFERLRHFVEARPIRHGDEMPEHDLVWIDEIKDGPAQTLLAAIKANPELWAHAVPEGCCIVQKEWLNKLVGAAATEALERNGAAVVENHAARARHEAEEKERERRP